MNLFICNCRIFPFVPLDGATGKKCGFYKKLKGYMIEMQNSGIVPSMP